jgi:hypothetical protein
MDQNLQIPMSTITNTVNRSAKRATTRAEKAYLFEIVEALGTAIGAEHPQVKPSEFMTTCGVSPDWKTVVAA